MLITGYIIGRASLDDKDAGIIGMLLAALIWIVWSIISYVKGNSLIMYLNGAKKVDPGVYPQLYNVVEEMKLAANLPAVPDIYIIDDFTPNAFATGRSPKKSAIAVTAGLLKMLNRDELQGVIAHEIAHILNRDSLYMTFAGLMLGTINLFTKGFLWGVCGSAGKRVRFRGKRSGKVGSSAPFMIFAIIFALLAPVMARIFYFTLSRKKEYLADATAVRLTRYPTGLANALAKISGCRTELSSYNSTTQPMYIVQPFVRNRRPLSSGMFATHPPVKKRIKILRSIINNANYEGYQKAFNQFGKSRIIPQSQLREREIIGLRKPAFQKETPVNKRDLGDLIRAVNGFIFLTCICGLKMKLPPGFKKTEVDCPRCQRHIQVPLQKMAVLMTLLHTQQKKKAKKAQGMQSYDRKSKGWESFTCTNCGKICQLSPGFLGERIKCNRCKSTIKIG